MYDRPFASFQPITKSVSHELFVRLAEKYPEHFGGDSESSEMTAFTRRDDNGTVHLRPDRPGLLVSSTSWTKDEDFSILLDALERENLF